MNVPEASTGRSAIGELQSGPSGFGRELSRTGSKPWHTFKKAYMNLRSLLGSPKGVGPANKLKAIRWKARSQTR